MKPHLLAIATAVLALVACEQSRKPAGAADEELTIVVQADRSRIAGEEAILTEQRRALGEERDRLRQEIERVGQGADAAPAQALLERAITLIRDQEELAARRDALARDRDVLLQRLAPTEPAAASATANEPGVGLVREVVERERDLAGREKVIAERERALAQREQVVAGREAAVAGREGACPGLTAAAPVPAEPSREEVDVALKALISAMEAKGVLASDLAPARQRDLREAREARATGKAARALELIEAVHAAVASIAIDAPFIEAKVKRVGELQQKRSPPPRVREEVSRLLQEVTRSYSDGRYSDANRALNRIEPLVDRRSAK